ncbi:cytochrome c oxidase assembly protein [Kribbella sp. ALI-6-A]|uniref:cytochrome c oxidase assembly protein n=1 Tax=Kribbella sp. ALI-6-A TaxID=1933817 RepID=UPI000A06C149|nr:cytochrome c oxidase assembly protein [Kribbella sp. ALI-6-A]
MIGMHAAHSSGSAAGLVPALAVAVAYVWAAQRLRRRGDSWSGWRTLSFVVGVLALGAVLQLPDGEFTAHMTQHLVIGMLAPLLIVLARPFTLMLRVLPPSSSRRALLRVVHSRWSGWLISLPVVAVLEAGSLWALYRTPLFASTQQHPWLHALVHLHVLLTGLLFTFAICQLDPVRRRYGLLPRAATVVLTGAAHAVLAKSLYAEPPPGTTFTPADLAAGAKLMYYGGDVVEIALAVVLALQWYRAEGRALARTQAV